MSRYDLRWATRHPARWLGHWWHILTLAAALYLIAATWTDPTFTVIRLDPIWPIALTVAATLTVAAAIAPFHHPLRIAAGASLITVAAFRVFFYLDVILLEGVPAAQAAQLTVQIGHWILAGLIGVALPSIIGDTGLRATLEAGRDDRGRRDYERADGGGQ